MSIYNKATDRNIHNRINRKYTKNQIHRSTRYSKLKHIHFVLLSRRKHKQYCRNIVQGYSYEQYNFNPYSKKPSKYYCCL